MDLYQPQPKIKHKALTAALFALIVVTVTMAPLISGVSKKVLVPILCVLSLFIMIVLGVTFEWKRKLGYFLKILPWTRFADHHNTGP